MNSLFYKKPGLPGFFVLKTSKAQANNKAAKDFL